MMKSTLYLLALCCATQAWAQRAQTVAMEPNEQWYGLAVTEGSKMPFAEGYFIDLHGDNKGNQAAPLLLSSHGRYIWNETPFACSFKNGQVKFTDFNDSLIIEKAGGSLKEAYEAASKRFFPASGQLPDPLLFAQPQYNTWIELNYNQNQADILKYAHRIIDNGFPPGVLMIDDNWAPYYGRFEFRKDRFPDAKAMTEELHRLGFKIMIWVCPFIRPDSEESRFLTSKKWVVMDQEGDKKMRWEQARKPLLVHWWNGYSMVMDLTQEAAVSWFRRQLDGMVQQYGVDGFKLDAGDAEFYLDGVFSNNRSPLANEQTALWGGFGLKYPLNEYRAMWKQGGKALAERLRDKNHSWEDLQKLIPDITTAGLLGYPFACPDMIGGGDWESFVNRTDYDQELVVRSAQCSALMPMMQFSVAPWRILDKEHFEAVKKAVALRKQFTPLIMELAKRAAETGAPIVTNLEYAFPNQGLSGCKDQFMLGDSIMVAPMVKKGTCREVVLPAGLWTDSKGKKVKGNRRVRYEVKPDELLWFKK